MNERPIVHLHLELDPDADPIAGVVHAGDEGARPFSGWMELTRAVELTLDGARQTPGPGSEAAL